MTDTTNIAEGTGSSADLSAASGLTTRRSKRFYRGPLFLLTVLLPTCLSVIYFGILASDVYISDARFVVRSPARQASSPLGTILNAGGFSGSSEESNAVMEYVRSRDALKEINSNGLIRTSFSNPEVSWFDRFGTLLRGNTGEHLYVYYLGKVSIENDAALQVTRLTVRAFTPKDAQIINQRLLRQSEALVNRLAERARGDAIAIARGELYTARARARAAAVALSRFQGQQGILDPQREGDVRMQMIAKLQDELISTKTQLQQLRAFTPQASQIPFVRSRIQSLEKEIADQTSSVAGGEASLSKVAVRFQELRLDNQLAEKQFAAALTALEEAQAESRRKRAYVERISEPSLPDYAAEPRRLRGIFATLVLSLLFWGVLSMLLAGVREHQD
jgi:ABC-2 type transport system permease protein/capsular polysaccharide transport system permease protein